MYTTMRLSAQISLIFERKDISACNIRVLVNNMVFQYSKITQKHEA